MGHFPVHAITPLLFCRAIFFLFLFCSFLYSSRFFFLHLLYIKGNSFGGSLKTLKNRKMATATSITTNDDVPSNYHTVAICADLPKIDKYYSIEKSKDLPPNDYWLNKMDKKGNKACYKVQHIIANGPCE
jgi:hypothetical protein